MLKHPIRYAEYVVFQAEDLSYIAEPADDGDDLQIRSRDLQELFAALDLIEQAGSTAVVEAPRWLSDFLSEPTSSITLPSAIDPVKEPAIVVAGAGQGEDRLSSITRLVFLSARQYHSPEEIASAMRNGSLWRLMPTPIERRFGRIKWDDVAIREYELAMSKR